MPRLEALRISGPFANSELVIDWNGSTRAPELVASIYLNDLAETQGPRHSLVFTYCPLQQVHFEDEGPEDAPALWLNQTCIAIPREHTDAVIAYLLAAGSAAATPGAA